MAEGSSSANSGIRIQVELALEVPRLLPPPQEGGDRPGLPGPSISLPCAGTMLKPSPAPLLDSFCLTSVPLLTPFPPPDILPLVSDVPLLSVP